MKLHIRLGANATVTNNGGFDSVPTEWAFDADALDIAVEGVPLGLEAMKAQYQRRTDLLLECAHFLRVLPLLGQSTIMQRRAELEEQIGKAMEGTIDAPPPSQ